MNERPTPETDQFKIKLKTTCGEKYWVPVEHSERLERERDEAREHLSQITEYGTEEINAAVELRSKLAQALIERDEAREALLKIEEIYIDGYDTYDSWKAMGEIAQAAIKDIK